MGKEVFGTKEWASSNVNIQYGCENNCRYCYARAKALQNGQLSPESWSKPVLRMDCIRKNYGKRAGTIMFPTAHDITSFNIDEFIDVLLKLLRAGNRVLVVSKPRTVLIDRICTECIGYDQQILFRFTIGSSNNDVLKLWEPNAPTYSDRVLALRFAFEHGFKTSVSMEPYLDDRPDLVIESVRQYVTDAIWVGKANLLVERLKVNGEWNDMMALEVEKIKSNQSDKAVRAIYARYKDDPIVKWKESIKRIVGIPVPTTPGLDV